MSNIQTLNSRSIRTAGLGLFVALVLAASACGSSDGDDTVGTPTAETTPVATATAAPVTAEPTPAAEQDVAPETVESESVEASQPLPEPVLVVSPDVLVEGQGYSLQVSGTGWQPSEVQVALCAQPESGRDEDFAVEGCAPAATVSVTEAGEFSMVPQPPTLATADWFHVAAWNQAGQQARVVVTSTPASENPAPAPAPTPVAEPTTEPVDAGVEDAEPPQETEDVAVVPFPDVQAVEPVGEPELIVPADWKPNRYGSGQEYSDRIPDYDDPYERAHVELWPGKQILFPTFFFLYWPVEDWLPVTVQAVDDSTSPARIFYCSPGIEEVFDSAGDLVDFRVTGPRQLWFVFAEQDITRPGTNWYHLRLPVETYEPDRGGWVQGSYDHWTGETC